MIQGRIQQGRVEIQGQVPAEWEGQWVKLVPLTPEDPLPDLEERLQALHALGPMEFDPGEPEEIASLLTEMNQMSKEALEHLAGRPQ